MVYQCRDCKHMFVAGQLTSEQLTDMYSNYYPRTDFNVDDYVPHKEKNGFLYWLDGEEGYAYRHVPKNVRILDIGCGLCETLGYHKNRGCEVYGVEADENIQKIAEQYAFNVEMGLFDAKKYEPESFDYVTMDQVLEHIVDPLMFLKDVNSVLKPGGKLVAAFPNSGALGRFFFGSRWVGWHLPFHRHFYTKHSLGILASQSGYEVEVMKSATPSLSLLLNWGILLYSGKKGQKASDFLLNVAYNRTKNAMNKNSGRGRFGLFLKKIRFLCLSMRLADLLGVGDSSLVILRKQ